MWLYSVMLEVPEVLAVVYSVDISSFVLTAFLILCDDAFHVGEQRG